MENIVKILEVLERENVKFLEVTNGHTNENTGHTYNIGEIALKLMQKQPSTLEVVLDYLLHYIGIGGFIRIVYVIISAISQAHVS